MTPPCPVPTPYQAHEEVAVDLAVVLLDPLLHLRLVQLCLLPLAGLILRDNSRAERHRVRGGPSRLARCRPGPQPAPKRREMGGRLHGVASARPAELGCSGDAQLSSPRPQLCSEDTGTGRPASARPGAAGL